MNKKIILMYYFYIRKYAITVFLTYSYITIR